MYLVLRAGMVVRDQMSDLLAVRNEGLVPMSDALDFIKILTSWLLRDKPRDTIGAF